MIIYIVALIKDFGPKNIEIISLRKVQVQHIDN